MWTFTMRSVLTLYVVDLSRIIRFLYDTLLLTFPCLLLWALGARDADAGAEHVSSRSSTCPEGCACRCEVAEGRY